MKIAIEGAGVGGSYLYFLLSKAGEDVHLYDINDTYIKACGEAVPNLYKPRFPWDVVDEIHEFSFFIDGKEMQTVNYRHPKWIIIDKAGWIQAMRNSGSNFIKGRLNDRRGYDLIIRAYGPYDLSRDVVTVVRAIVKANTQEHKGVIFEFDSRFSGFYWIFPSGNGRYNIGGGFTEIRNPTELVRWYISKKFKQPEIIDMRGAPLSIGRVSNVKYSIGEARGLVYPLTGEGIRPASISAECANEAIYKKVDVELYLQEKLKPVEYDIAFQRRLLTIYRLMPQTMRRITFQHMLNKVTFLDNYLDEKINIKTIFAN
ncbi:MAG: NAD(P)/FAD-dependent oxidoreductase [Conexivisphaerales archaeon]